MADIPYFLAGLLFSYADVPISSVGSRSLYTKRVHMCPFSFRKRQSMSDHGVEIHCARCQNSCVFGNRIRHTLYGLCQTRIVIYGVRRHIQYLDMCMSSSAHVVVQGRYPSHMSACRCLGIGDSGPNAVSGVSMGRSIEMSRGSAISYSGNVIRQDVVQNMVRPAGFEPAAIGL